MESSSRRWGDASALADDDEARRRLLDAAARCIQRRGNAQIRMAEVADEAGVVRSTVYRYFATRDSLLLDLLLLRIDNAMAAQIDSLHRPNDAEYSILQLMMAPIGWAMDDPLNLALVAGDTTALNTALELGSEQIVDVILRHAGPLVAHWQDSGQIHADLDPRELVRWIHTASLFLMSAPWRSRSTDAKREFVGQYLIRALVLPAAP